MAVNKGEASGGPKVIVDFVAASGEPEVLAGSGAAGARGRAG
jgi:hypothetical protein